MAQKTHPLRWVFRPDGCGLMGKVLKDPPKNRFRLPLLVAAAVLVVMTAIFVSMFRDMGVVNLLKLRDTEKQLRAEVDQLRRENADLKSQVEGLKSNPSVIEGEARRMGLVREKERVIVIP